MSDYYHRHKMQDEPCPMCDNGIVTGNRNNVSCDECSFSY